MTVWLGDLKNENGSSGYYPTDELTSRLARFVVDRMTGTAALERLSDIVGHHHARAFFLVRCKTLIWPLARAHILADLLPVGDPQAPQRVAISDSVLYPILKEAWTSERVELVLESKRLNIRNLGKRIRTQMRILRLLMRSRGGSNPHLGLGTVAVECNQLDMSRKSVPFRFNSIPTDRTLLCSINPAYPIRKTELAEYENLGFRWVSLVRNAVEGTSTNWRPGPLGGTHVAEYRKAISEYKLMDGLERWVVRVSESLLRRVDYWQAFFSQHNIRVFVLRSGGAEEKIAKRIAAGLAGVAMVLSQRSHIAARGNQVGVMTADAVFCWGNPQTAIGQDNENFNDHLVITGFNGGEAFDEDRVEGQAYRTQLAQAGARFVIGLFDNTYGPDFPHSRSNMTSFYRHFLTWVLDGQDRGLLIKPKRDYIPSDLSEIKGLLSAAEASGRCLVASEDVGPQVAAFGSDLCVGIGHSSAAVISAIAGCRAVHCDSSGTPSHHLESWGLGQVLFHDLVTLGEAIERHIQEPEGSLLGDFSPVMDDLDPFRDGDASARIDSYVGWLLDAYDAGLGRDQALQEASSKYAASWGADKVISFEPKVLEQTAAS